MPERVARFITLDGRVQGVGFRPFVYRLAHRHGIHGWVRNVNGAVEIHAEGEPAQLQRFGEALLNEAPPLSAPGLPTVVECAPEQHAAFSILDSEAGREADVHLPPDGFVCADCLAELHDPANRRYRYPFINCTQCGPRYTLIAALPYDRPNTAMREFALCPDCRQEYENPLDRRFHAEPIACPVCGPHLAFSPSPLRGEGWGLPATCPPAGLVDWLGVPSEGETHAEVEDFAHIPLSPTPLPPGERGISDEAALAAAVAALRNGKIVAVKGVGGYHLMCDAANDAAIATLRARKPRPAKPLAVMLRDLDALRAVVRTTPELENFIASPARPIVLLPKRDHAALSPLIAPGLEEIGCLLPYSPLHDLLLHDFGGPLVATSGNLSGEPVLTGNADAQTRLAHLADAFLHHGRLIVRPADDPVYRVIAGAPRALRLGRGSAPLELDLPVPLSRPILALGSHMKNTVCLAWGSRAVVSPHIGELDSVRSLDTLAQVAADLQRLYRVRATQLIVDHHPGYGYRRYARDSGLPLAEVRHHHAHASALAWEFPEAHEWIVFTWDGVGYGEDGTLWGGEAFTGAPGRWQRAASMRPFHLPGGDKAGREPWRAAAALLWETGQAAPFAPDPLHRAWLHGINSPASSAVGRLFDAAAALCGICNRASFEGEGPMRLETQAACESTRALARSGSESFRDTLTYPVVVIASEAKQSRMPAKSTASGSPRHFVPRDDRINRRLLNVKQRAALPRPPLPQAGERRGGGNGHGVLSFHIRGRQDATTVRAKSAGEVISLPLERDADGIWRSDWAPLLPMLGDASLSTAERAARFHLGLAQALVDQATQLRAQTGIQAIGLTGGVFQNRVLAEAAIGLLDAEGFSVFLPQRLPVNDAGLSFGQVIEFLHQSIP